MINGKKVWLTSDTHFGHENIIKYCDRPFSSVEEMDRTMIDNWNARVGEDDIVFHLGDFALSKGKARIPEIVAELNGTIHLILGNHDLGEASMKKRGFDVVWPKGKWLDSCHMGLRHRPPFESLKSQGGQWFCGHVHNAWTVHREDPPHGHNWILNVGVDVHGFSPISLPEALSIGYGARD